MGVFVLVAGGQMSRDGDCSAVSVPLSEVSQRIAKFEADGCVDLRVKRTPNGLWRISKYEPSAATVVVSGAGSPEINGIYTQRGIVYGKPWYNLEGEPDNTDLFAIWWNGLNWEIYNQDAATAYTSDEEDIATPDLVTHWNLGDGSAPAPTVIRY